MAVEKKVPGKHDIVPIPDKYELYSYVSSQADTNSPARTLYVIPPSQAASSVASLEAFARETGWIELAEKDWDVLVMPVTKKGWAHESPDLLAELYDDTKRGFVTRKPGDEGRESIWCWETMIYAVGYEDGAAFVGRNCVKHPNRFAGVALVGGVPNGYSDGELESTHWLVAGPTADYSRKNRDIPVPVWFFEHRAGESEEAVRYFCAANRAPSTGTEAIFDGIPTVVYQDPREEAWQVRVSPMPAISPKAMAETIFNTFFLPHIRWKNSPDGTPKPNYDRFRFYATDAFTHYDLQLNGNAYPYHVHLPKGMTKEQAAGLPVVFSLHGAHEPAWVFAAKNGWDSLADETGEFLLVLPDSPLNRWVMGRDDDVLAGIIDRLYEDYRIDRERVYVSGFSNGSQMTCEQSARRPWLWAAMSPWNSIRCDEMDAFRASGYEMPAFLYVGGADMGPGEFGDPTRRAREVLIGMLEVNGCLPAAASAGAEPVWGNMTLPCPYAELRDASCWYTGSRGYRDGERFTTYVFSNESARPRVCFTVMKNMPHGAVYDESRAAWEFMKHFKRPGNGKQVVEI